MSYNQAVDKIIQEDGVGTIDYDENALPTIQRGLYGDDV